jgi:hypothetical protein
MLIRIVRTSLSQVSALYQQPAADARTLSYEQPFLPVFHRKFANPSPLAVNPILSCEILNIHLTNTFVQFTALGTGLFLVAIVALGADGLSNLSIVVSVCGNVDEGYELT